jgi:hypothetical protein
VLSITSELQNAKYALGSWVRGVKAILDELIDRLRGSQ